ncbi:enoyl-CoA hydratase/isomerase family protein [Patulibacter minatonensis]|uniref:enoyl-CoA hydratase/isomerase family protein n=1 Tax=Patulibacter minatonensis TaxID=298163 RepID=UPI00047D7DA5|nr:enoyl-CoA hydratase-related protein [Patulibacter minatonensis]
MTEQTAEKVVHWEDTEHAFVITLKRPPANALGFPIIEGIGEALDVADRDAPGKVLIFASEIEGFFAAGADIKFMVDTDQAGFEGYGDALRGGLDRIADPSRIAIAAVDGLALGGGCELAMACALRVAGPQAQFGLPEVKIGLIPGAGGTQRLPRLVGRGRALDIILTARQVPAEEAVRIGLADRLVDGDPLDTALEIAKTLSRSSRPALEAAVRCVDAAFDLPLPEGIAYEADEENTLFRDGEAKEGLKAFVERRRPEFGK